MTVCLCTCTTIFLIVYSWLSNIIYRYPIYKLLSKVWMSGKKLIVHELSMTSTFCMRGCLHKRCRAHKSICISYSAFILLFDYPRLHVRALETCMRDRINTLPAWKLSTQSNRAGKLYNNKLSLTSRLERTHQQPCYDHPIVTDFPSL